MRETPKIENSEKPEREISLKEKIKMATAAGMAAMAIGGIPGMDNKSHAAEIAKDTATGNIALPDLGVAESKAKFEALIDEEFRKHREQKAEQVREELIRHFGSKEFLERLKIEHDGKEKVAEEIQRSCLENLKTCKIHCLSFDEIKKELEERGSDRKLADFYSPSEHAIYVFSDRGVRHEFIHAATRSMVSKRAAGILDESYKKRLFGFLDKEHKYLKQPWERLVRKQTLDYEMEKLGIKKYGDKFTKDHYERLMQFYWAGKLSKDSRQFIETTQPKFEYFEKIFNEIAQNENSGSEIKPA